jgi:hypothetical protein
MLEVEIVHPEEVARAAAIFHRDGFVVVRDALTPAQLAFAQEGARRVIAEQMAVTPLEKGNRGHARYSFGPQLHHPEWLQLVDLPTILPILDRIWESTEYLCMGGGGDYSAPGAQIQPLHSDMGDFLKDPLGQVTVRDLPAPFIVVNFMMVEFREINGATRFVPGTVAGRGAGADEALHPLRPGRHRRHPRRALLARRHRQPLRGDPPDDQRRLLRPLVPPAPVWCAIATRAL